MTFLYILACYGECNRKEKYNRLVNISEKRFMKSHVYAKTAFENIPRKYFTNWKYLRNIIKPNLILGNQYVNEVDVQIIEI